MTSPLTGYLHILAVGVYSAELLTLGTGFVTILRHRNTTENMDYLYLMNIVKIFVITGFLIFQCGFSPKAARRTLNRALWTTISSVTLLVVGVSLYFTVREVLDNLQDETEANDYLAYIVIATYVVQSLFLGAFTALLVKHMHMLEAEDSSKGSLLSRGDGKESKAVESILNKMSKA